MAQRLKTGGLSTLLQGMPIPEFPTKGATPEQLHWWRQMKEYLRRLMGEFTGAQIFHTMTQEIPLELQAWICSHPCGEESCPTPGMTFDLQPSWPSSITVSATTISIVDLPAWDIGYGEPDWNRILTWNAGVGQWTTGSVKPYGTAYGGKNFYTTILIPSCSAGNLVEYELQLVVFADEPEHQRQVFLGKKTSTGGPTGIITNTLGFGPTTLTLS